jgi:hypothetical protein
MRIEDSRKLVREEFKRQRGTSFKNTCPRDFGHLE